MSAGEPGALLDTMYGAYGQGGPGSMTSTAKSSGSSTSTKSRSVMPVWNHNFARGPFPQALRADARAAYFESIDEADVSRYVILRARPFDAERTFELVEQGVPLEEQYPEIRRLGRAPMADARWLYTLESFTVARAHHADQESFVDHSEHYVSRVFDDLGAALTCSKSEFGVGMSDFRKQFETNYVS